MTCWIAAPLSGAGMGVAYESASYRYSVPLGELARKAWLEATDRRAGTIVPPRFAKKLVPCFEMRNLMKVQQASLFLEALRIG
jgi:hypothetical protein